MSGISYSFEYLRPHGFPFGPNKWMTVEILVDGNSVAMETYLFADPDGEQRPVAPLRETAEHILAAFLDGGEAELRIMDGDVPVHSTTIPLTGFKKAANWVLRSCMTAAG